MNALIKFIVSTVGPVAIAAGVSVISSGHVLAGVLVVIVGIVISILVIGIMTDRIIVREP